MWTSAAVEPDEARLTACLSALGNLEKRYRSPEAKAALREARARTPLSVLGEQTATAELRDPFARVSRDILSPV